MNEKSLLKALKHLPLSAVQYYKTIGSTNNAALAWAKEGVEDGALVVSNEQTAGRGRFDHAWVTRPGSALAFSLVLRPSERAEKSFALYAPLGALAVSIALEGLGLHPQIKWPNDVLLDRCKVCGILSEASWRGEQMEYVVLGMGVNVTKDSLPPPETLQFPAASVEETLGRHVGREGLLAAVLEAFFEWRPRMYSDAFIEAWQERLAFRGERVVVSNVEAKVEAISGKLLGISRQGALRIKMDDGREEEVLAGDLHLRPMQ